MSRARSMVRGSKSPRLVLAPLPETEPPARRQRNSNDPRPLDWDTAVHAARALLDEAFGLPASTNDPAMTDMAQELAARLCAYDEILDAVDHMRTCLPDESDLP